MNTKIMIAGLLIFIANLNSQQWVNNYDFQSSYSGYAVVQMQFLNANTGWVSLKNAGNVRMLKTTNKGNTWFQINSFDMYTYSSSRPYFVFLNENTGYRAHTIYDIYGQRTLLDKSVDGGATWVRKIDYIQNAEGDLPLIIFKNTNEGYLIFSDTYSGQNIVKVYKTTDGFETSSNIHTQDPIYQRNFKLNDIFIDNSQIIYAVGRNRYFSNSSDDFFVCGYGSSFFRSYGPAVPNTYLHFMYGAALGSNIRYIGVEGNVNNNYPGTRFYVDYNPQNSILIDPQTTDNNVGGLSFSDNSKGFTTVDNKVYVTFNSGSSWQQEGTLASSVNFSGGHTRLESFSDVCYAVSYPGKFHTRLIHENLNTMFDWAASSSGSMAIDGINYGTPSQQYVRGGTCSFYANPFIINGSDTTARFYYWGGNLDGSMNWNNNNSYLIYSNSQVNADYKTKLLSNNSSALKNANQVNILKDTNGVTNLSYESMGGIFYTRTKPDGNFKAEEIISGTNGSSQYGYATFNNSNPFIAELKPYLFSTPNPPEKNVWVCWERREGNNIKIMVSARSLDPLNRPEWYISEYATITDAPVDFKAFPKLVITGNIQYNTRVLTFLKPVSGTTNKKLAGKVFYNNNPNVQEFEIVAPANIQEYAMTSITNDGINGGANIFNLYLTYRINQTVLYKQIKLGWDQLVSLPYYSVVGNEQVISNDNSRWRASLDISLKNSANSTGTFNMQPVVTYQGRYDVRILIDDEDGPPIEQQGAYYPIYVKEKLSNGSWSSSVISYNSPLNTVQMNPNIEGSKHMNSCILDYARGSAAPYTFYKVVPRWNGQTNSGYGITPTSYIGTDAKFIKSGLINNSSTSHKLMTLSLAGGSLYNLGTQSFSITNETQGDDNFVSLYGMVEANDVQYTFNLGNILVNSQNIGFDTDIDTVIDNLGQLNSNLVSTSFLLNENDTLIIGRNAAYVLNDPNGAPINIEYQVKLMNKTTSSMHRLLAHDTLNVADSVIYEFLEGYVIRNIPNGSDSFYVQLEIDTVDGDYGIGGGIGGDGEGGDSPNGGIKKKIFWANENLTLKENNLPKEFALYQNFPNPFNPVTLIKYDLPKDVNVTIKIYDLLGREVATLVNNELKKAGRYELNWNAGNYASGVFFYRIEAGSYVNSKKMVIIK